MSVLTRVFSIKSGRRCAPSWGPALTLRPLCPRSARARSPLRGSLGVRTRPRPAAVGARDRPLGTEGGWCGLRIEGPVDGQLAVPADGAQRIRKRRKASADASIRMIVSRRRL